MIKVGDAIELVDVKKGHSEKGDWMFINKKDKYGKTEATIWARNVDEARNFVGEAKIEKILDVSIRKRKSEQGTWFTDVNISCELSGNDTNAGVRGDAFSGFMSAIGGAADEGLPFN